MWFGIGTRHRKRCWECLQWAARPTAFLARAVLRKCQPRPSQGLQPNTPASADSTARGGRSDSSLSGSSLSDSSLSGSSSLICHSLTHLSVEIHHSAREERIISICEVAPVHSCIRAFALPSRCSTRQPDVHRTPHTAHRTPHTASRPQCCSRQLRSQEPPGYRC